jgi:cation:H+ antiporter
LIYIYLIVGLILVIKGADTLVNGASTIARGLNISEFIIGLTVVSFGTSLPELVIALISGAQGSPDLIIGNIAGSNIANILLVLGVAATIRSLPATNNTVKREIPFTVIASLLMIILLNNLILNRGVIPQLTRIEGGILLGFFLLFMLYAAQIIRQQTQEENQWLQGLEEHTITRSTIEIIAGIFALVIGGKLAVDYGAVPIAKSWGMTEAMIGLTIIAIGTSLPELATSAVAAYKKNVDIAVGNVVGSNIFNILIVLGITSTVKPIPYNTDFNIDLAIMLLSTIILLIFMFIGHPKKTIQRKEGILLVTLYIAYTIFTIKRG